MAETPLCGEMLQLQVAAYKAFGDVLHDTGADAALLSEDLNFLELHELCTGAGSWPFAACPDFSFAPFYSRDTGKNLKKKNVHMKFGTT